MEEFDRRKIIEELKRDLRRQGYSWWQIRKAVKEAEEILDGIEIAEAFVKGLVKGLEELAEELEEDDE